MHPLYLPWWRPRRWQLRRALRHERFTTRDLDLIFANQHEDTACLECGGTGLCVHPKEV